MGCLLTEAVDQWGRGSRFSDRPCVCLLGVPEVLRLREWARAWYIEKVKQLIRCHFFGGSDVEMIVRLDSPRADSWLFFFPLGHPSSCNDWLHIPTWILLSIHQPREQILLHCVMSTDVTYSLFTSHTPSSLIYFFYYMEWCLTASSAGEVDVK